MDTVGKNTNTSCLRIRVQKEITMSITKWKNIIMAPTQEKREKLIDKLTEADAKDFLKFLVKHMRGADISIEDIK
jgi:hypothetical protein